MIDRTFGTSLAALALVATVPLAAEQWTGWRGGSRAAISAAPMPATLAAKAADVWAVPVGIGHASPLVDGQRVYVFARKGEQEVAQALDLATGKALWSAGYDQPYTMNSAATGHGKGPKSTPLLAGGRLYTLGITGVLSALDAATGKVAWRHAFDKEFGPPPDFGTAMSPDLRQRPRHRPRRRHPRRRAARLRSRDRRDEVELGRRRPRLCLARGDRRRRRAPDRRRDADARSSASTPRPARCSGRCRSSRPTSRTP